MARLELRGISKRYGQELVLDEVELEVADGEFLVLVGPSGCGKSTLLRIVAGLLPASSGTLLLDGERIDELEPKERDVAMVFQSYALYPHMSVRGNLAFPLRMQRRPRAEIERRVRETAEVLGLSALLERKPGALSGGQMQRVALGRAIVRDPRLFLFDEPLSNLDAKLRDEMRAEIKRLHERLAITTLYVTHDQAEAMTMGSRICVLSRGRIEQVGAPLEVFERPATSFVAAFIGSPAMNLLRGRAAGGTFRHGPLELDGAPADGELLLGVRPHDIALGEGGELEVAAVEQLGTRTLAELRLGEEHLTVAREGAWRVAPGQRLAVSFPPERRHWFDAHSGARLPAQGARVERT